MAEYRDKNKGRSPLFFFDPTTENPASGFLRIEEELRLAITLGQFKLFYQPQFNFYGEILAVEALLRWQHPKHGLISPDEFIAIAEHSGLILPIGLWVLETACDQIDRWQSDPFLSRLNVSINVSPGQFNDHGFVEKFTRVIESKGVNASQLKFEITESLVHEPALMRDKMEAIRKLGVKFSLDDFGTGYSSLESLIKLPIDQIKIDRSFVREMLSNGPVSIVVKTIISMANELGMEVVAEGVETETEKNFLHSIGCSLYQGYLSSHPISSEEFEEICKDNDLPAAYKNLTKRFSA